MRSQSPSPPPSFKRSVSDLHGSVACWRSEKIRKIDADAFAIDTHVCKAVAVFTRLYLANLKTVADDDYTGAVAELMDNCKTLLLMDACNALDYYREHTATIVTFPARGWPLRPAVEWPRYGRGTFKMKFTADSRAKLHDLSLAGKLSPKLGDQVVSEVFGEWTERDHPYRRVLEYVLPGLCRAVNILNGCSQ